MRALLGAEIVSVAAAAGWPTLAGIVDTPDCRRDLATAHQLIHAVRLRENSVQPGDFVGLCRL